MQSDYTGHINSAEWRWVIVVSCFFALLAFFPFLWVLLVGINNDQWRFMGALHDYQNSAVHLSMMEQGANGSWLMKYLHTPEAHGVVLTDTLYTLLGYFARLTGFSPILMFHVARVSGAVFMYLALYQLASHIWTRVRTRRIFFVMTVIGSGSGWILVPLTRSFDYIDLQSPYLYPFFSSLTNVHLPLAVASVALLASVIILIFRPGETPLPTVSNGGGIVFGFTLLLMFIYPFAYLPILTAFLINLLIYWLDHRKITKPHLHWLSLFVVPALPLLVYNALVFQNNAVVEAIWRQQGVLPPSPILLLLAVIFPFVLAFPGVMRAIRRFNRDSDQFMFIWLVVMVAWVYLPVAGQEQFLLGFMIPISYFATRAIVEFWFGFIKKMWQMRVFAAILPILGMSHLFTLLLPLYPIAIDNRLNDDAGILLQRDYISAFTWLRNTIQDRNVVILAAPNTSLWLPAWTGSSVVYGHPSLTLQPETKLQAVNKWYQSTTLAQCNMRLLFGDYSFLDRRYAVTYVLMGPQEARLGQGVCVSSLRAVARFGAVWIYEASLSS